MTKSTGRRIRGRVPCNTAIGKLGDTIQGVKRALAYLEGVR